jgi:hypothetical protein
MASWLKFKEQAHRKKTCNFLQTNEQSVVGSRLYELMRLLFAVIKLMQEFVNQIISEFSNYKYGLLL